MPLDAVERRPDHGGRSSLFKALEIISPKRSSQCQSGWDGFFPYYAGYPETFVRSLLTSAALPDDAVVADPWNGSGTTTYAASQLGHTSRGLDLNPVMVIIARARLLAPSEADSLEPLSAKLVKNLRVDPRNLAGDDPLLVWYMPPVAALIRAIEKRIRDQLVGKMTLLPTGTRLDRISGFAATLYVALFSVCRALASRFQSSNPTWLRHRRKGEVRIKARREEVIGAFLANIRAMASALAARVELDPAERGEYEIRLADSTTASWKEGSIDMIITSPPYCTRIDYTAATRIELAVIEPLLQIQFRELGRQMIGSTRVPDHEIQVSEHWGDLCTVFLAKLKKHKSKASAGYYYKTHVDYFDKMARSLDRIASSMKDRASAIFVVQDSYYKDLHNDLPSIIVQMADAAGLKLRRRDDFHLSRSMAGINPHTKMYKRASGAVEAVLCLEKA
jgi:hypothetical protein